MVPSDEDVAMLRWMQRKKVAVQKPAEAVVRPSFLERRPSPEPTGQRLVFLGGAPRSGIMLLQHMLDSHPDVFGGPAFDCVPAMVETWERVRQTLESKRIALYCTPPQVDRAFAGMIESLLLPVADANGAKLLSDGTPFNVLAFSGLLELLPACRVIHIVRDPRAVVASMLQVAERCTFKKELVPDFMRNVGSAVRFTKTSLEAGFIAAREFSQRVLTLTYEMLVSQPEAIARRVCGFLDVPFDGAMLEPHAIKHPGQEQAAELAYGTLLDRSFAVRPIEPSRVSAWTQYLDGTQIDLVQETFRSHQVLRSLGYQFS
jgi:hypothetical protein